MQALWSRCVACFWGFSSWMQQVWESVGKFGIKRFRAGLSHFPQAPPLRGIALPASQDLVWTQFPSSHHDTRCMRTARCACVPQKLVALLSTYSRPELQRLVVMLQQYITLTLYQQQAITRGVEDATQVGRGE